MFVFRFALRNVSSRKSSVVIVLFIAFAIALLVVSNAVFDGTDNGIETTFINSFTGNIVIRPKANFPLSLFGDETPVTGELSEIPSLVPYTELVETVQNTKGIKTVTPQITGMAALSVNDVRIPTALFGVQGEDYIRTMSAIQLEEGTAFSAGQKGIMLSRRRLEQIRAQTGVDVQLGDSVQLITADGLTFSIRAATLTGIYSYAVQNDVLDKIALLDDDTVRSLMGVVNAGVDESAIAAEEKNLIESELDIDDLFADAEDFFVENAAADAATRSAEEAFFATEENSVQTDSSVWSFLICKTDGSVSDSAIIAELNRTFKKYDWQVQAVNWRTAAGGTVYLIFYLRVIFNIGIILILLTGFIVVTNTLTISALDRVQETGTLRAIGADRRFVALQFLFETGILTVTAGVLGCILGCVINNALSAKGITISNQYLMQLFGGNTLDSVVTAQNITRCLLLSVVLAFIGWAYPVHVALDANPVVAMRGGGR